MKQLVHTVLAAIVLGSAAPLGGQTAPASAPAATPEHRAATRRAVRAADIYRLRDVRDPQRSPEGTWVAYTVTSADTARDKNDSDVWMTSWDGVRSIRLTTSNESENTPRWSPDGRYLAFLSGRQDAGATQLWLLERAGGEAVKLSDLKGDIDGYAWSPDSRRIAMVVKDPEPGADDTSKTKRPKPIVVERYQFKKDIDGYVGARRSHLYLLDVGSKVVDTLTRGAYDEELPAWSPDGSRIAFVSKRGPDLDRDDNYDLFVIDARAGSAPRQVTTFPGEDNSPGSESPLAWSPDGKSIAYLQGGDPKYSAYNLFRLAVVPAAGGAPRVLTESLDRAVSTPVWARDGSSLVFLVVDDRAEYVGRVRASGGAVERLTSGRRVVADVSGGVDGAFAVLASTAAQPPEIFALENGRLRQLSHQNDQWIAELELGTTEDIEFRAKDGTEVHGLVVKPASYRAGSRVPAILRIHGGPNAQDQHSFSFERELLAASGYAVVATNYRGSSGRGAAYQRAIFADWGNKEVIDLLAAADWAVSSGIADPQRLGIGGWSYGGILTDYTIATDTRFKAATSGAGSAMQIGMYGADQYILQYDTELGPPWKSPELWMKLSYPFFHADRIRTPTLFMGGEKDFNVPINGSEQMYQALRSLGVDTQLVIYPGQYHGITRPSFKRDRLERYLAWYDRFLKPPLSSASTR